MVSRTTPRSGDHKSLGQQIPVRGFRPAPSPAMPDQTGSAPASPRRVRHTGRLYAPHCLPDRRRSRLLFANLVNADATWTTTPLRAVNPTHAIVGPHGPTCGHRPANPRRLGSEEIFPQCSQRAPLHWLPLSRFRPSSIELELAPGGLALTPQSGMTSKNSAKIPKNSPSS